MTQIKSNIMGTTHFQSVAIPDDASPEERIALAANLLPTPAQMSWHRDEFIAFIHYGPNAFSAREWGTGFEDASIFNPTDLDTDQWCRLMKAAGMKRVVLTAKHHDGYCLWQTRYTTHSVASSTWRDGNGDVMADLSASCLKYGLKLAAYLSPADLYQIENEAGLYGNLSEYSDRVIPRPVEGRPFDDPRSFTYRVDDYNEYFMNQLFEVLTEYGPVHEVWFDGAHPKRKGGQTYTYNQWYDLIRRLAPEAVIFGKGPDVRWCGNEGGGTRDSEWSVLPLTASPDVNDWDDLRESNLTSPEKLAAASHFHFYPAETNTSIRQGWFYRNDDEQSVRNVDDVFDIYERSVGGNTAFLLNIPPDREGKFPARDAACLEAVGQRIDDVYGTNLLDGATSAAPVLDGNPDSFWRPAKESGFVEIDLPEPRTLNRVLVQECLHMCGQRIEECNVEAFVDGSWAVMATGTTVGYKKIFRFPTVITARLRINVTQSRLQPTISHISAHYFDEPPKAVRIDRDDAGNISINALVDFAWNNQANSDQSQVIRYTLDGSDPTQEHGMTYRDSFAFIDGGKVKARTIANDQAGVIAERTFGIAKGDWIVVDCTSELADHPATNVLNGNARNMWLSDEGLPHSLTIDMGRSLTVSSFTYKPRQKGATPEGMVERFRLELSKDGQTWTTAVEDELGNLLNDPQERTIAFGKSITCRYLKFIALAGAQGTNRAGAAEIGIII